LWEFEKSAFRKISGSTNGEVREQWGRLHIEGLHGLCPTPNFVRVIKSIKRRLARKFMYEGKIQYLQDLDGKIILRWIFKKFVRKWATEFTSLRVGTNEGFS
jgi:hypothetical protein